MGKFKIVLKRKDWGLLPESEKIRIRKRLVISGVSHGLIENLSTTPVLEHQLSNQNRDGAIFTQNDGFSVTGVQLCSEETGAIVLNVVETLNIEKGTGIYVDLQAGGAVNLIGTVNFCTLQNDFDVIVDTGGLCFGSEICE